MLPARILPNKATLGEPAACSAGSHPIMGSKPGRGIK
jgi:hypothetical protein